MLIELSLFGESEYLLHLNELVTFLLCLKKKKKKVKKKKKKEKPKVCLSDLRVSGYIYS